jgi:hypothetical protein
MSKSNQLLRLKVELWHETTSCSSHTYSMQLLPHKSILTHKLWHLFLQSIIFLHQQLVHCRQFPIHSLKPWSLFSLLLSTSAHNNSKPHLSADFNFTHTNEAKTCKKTKILKQSINYLRFWNQTLICLGSMLERIGHSRINCCLLIELGLGHSA